MKHKVLAIYSNKSDNNNPLYSYVSSTIVWLVVSTPLKIYICQLG